MLVLHHGPACPDGFGAAWAAYQKLGENAVYVPINYNDQLPKEVNDHKEIYLVDFSFPRETMLALAINHKVTVLDHHKTAKAALEGLNNPNLHIVFDMFKSGAVLTWEHFFPGTPVPKLLEYVQDRDLWTWELPYSREISAALDLAHRDFGAWSHFGQVMEDDDGFNDTVRDGSVLLTYINKHVEAIAKKAFLKSIGDYNVPAVNSAIWQSEIGEKLCELHPEMPFAAIFTVKEDVETWSLRSRNGFDVSTVAKAFGGGGHAPAASFSLQRIWFPRI